MYVDTHIICIHVFEYCRFCHLLDFTELEYGQYSNVMTRKSTLSTDMCIHCHRGHVLCTALFIQLSHSRGHGDMVEVASVTLGQGGGGDLGRTRPLGDRRLKKRRGENAARVITLAPCLAVCSYFSRS